MKRNYLDMNREMTTKDWVITQLLLLIPIVNIVLLLIWGFQSNENSKFLTRKRYSQALLIFFAIIIVLYAIVFLGILVFGLSVGAIGH